MTPESRLDFYQQITEAARDHGLRSDPEHEVGDLQRAVNVLLSHMSEEQMDRAHKEMTEEHNLL